MVFQTKGMVTATIPVVNIEKRSTGVRGMASKDLSPLPVENVEEADSKFPQSCSLSRMRSREAQRL